MDNLISIDDCCIITKSNKQNINGFTLEKFSKETRGYICQHYLLTIKLATNKETNYFVKTVKNAAGYIECIADHDFFAKELFLYKFYDEIGAKTIPKYIHHIDKHTLILENLENDNYLGYKSMHCDKAHMKILLKTLAKFHSISFAYEADKSKTLNRKYQLSEDFAEHFKLLFSDDVNMSGFKYTKAAEKAGLMLIDMIYGEKGTELKKKLSNFVPTFLHLLNKSDYTKVLSHGDLWAYNVLYKYDNGIPIDSKFVDFQLIRYTPPAHDVTMAIYFCSSKESFCNDLDDYFKCYYEALQNELKQLGMDIADYLPLQEYQETCRVYIPCAKFIWLCYRQISLASDDALDEIKQDKVKLNEMFIAGSGRCDFVRKNYLNCVLYREGMISIIEDIKDALMS